MRKKGTQGRLAVYFDRLTDAGRSNMKDRFLIPRDVETWYSVNLTPGEAMAAFLASRGKLREVCNEVGQ